MDPIKPEIKKKESSPLVSIITPTYNHEKFIGTCIKTVLNQSYSNWEMIIIDDGSTDRTGDIVAEFKDDRIKYVKQENVGIWNLYKTYNKALDLSNGELIAILEGDDAWPSYKLEEQVKFFDNNNVIFSWGKKHTINDKNELISFDRESFEKILNTPQAELTRRLITANFIQPCTVMMDKQVLLSIGGFLQNKETPYVDYPTFLELSLKGRFYPSDRVLGYWRKHKAQVTTKQENDMNRAFMFPVEFYEKLDSSLKKSIKFNMEDKLKSQKIILNDQIAVSGRLSLVKGDWKKASTHFKSIFFESSLKIKIQSFIGIICALCKTDMEWFAVITCKPKIRDDSGEWNTTLFDQNGNLTNIFKIQIFIMNISRLIRKKPLQRFKSFERDNMYIKGEIN
ncbi:glycosyltransferase family 2 protein [uncultured Methanobacterium sp.]|uniref:glycosyltransferase family 2 protein n=1 Tax=uncultured Methanobacterium sp. TaxID=176306 RepID=UPI002AA80D90|nr:glycosyltransferase family 2 protein [uncultured Methanobacterium sp.]